MCVSVRAHVCVCLWLHLVFTSFCWWVCVRVCVFVFLALTVIVCGVLVIICCENNFFCPNQKSAGKSEQYGISVLVWVLGFCVQCVCALVHVRLWTFTGKSNQRSCVVGRLYKSSESGNKSGRQLRGQRVGVDAEPGAGAYFYLSSMHFIFLPFLSALHQHQAASEVVNAVSNSNANTSMTAIRIITHNNGIILSYAGSRLHK